jgi:hypothetical protein
MMMTIVNIAQLECPQEKLLASCPLVVGERAKGKQEKSILHSRLKPTQSCSTPDIGA